MIVVDKLNPFSIYSNNRIQQQQEQSSNFVMWLFPHLL